MMLFNLYVFSQSKKAQIIELNFQVDSLKKELIKQKGIYDFEILAYKKIIKEKVSILENVQNNLEEEILTHIKLLKIIDSLNLRNEHLTYDKTDRILIDTIRTDNQFNHFDCVSYSCEIPYINKFQFSDSIRELVNQKCIEMINRIPSISSNWSYLKVKKDFFNCDEELKNWKENGMPGVCDKPIFYESYLDSLSNKKYISFLSRVSIGNCGTTSPINGYNSVNFRMSDSSFIVIPPNNLLKKILIEDVRDYYNKLPFLEDGGENFKYDIVKAISSWGTDKLTFYFQNDLLHLVFMDDASWGLSMNHEIPLHKLHSYLKL